MALDNSSSSGGAWRRRKVGRPPKTPSPRAQAVPWAGKQPGPRGPHRVAPVPTRVMSNGAGSGPWRKRVSPGFSTVSLLASPLQATRTLVGGCVKVTCPWASAGAAPSQVLT